MLNAIVVSIRFILLVLGGQFKRSVPRPKLNNGDRLFWIGLYMILTGLEIRADDRAAGNRNLLASQVVQTVLVEVIPTETTRPTPNALGDPETHPNHGNR